MINRLPSLNPEQESAVRHGDGPLLVLAGAGTGKTRTLTSRIAHLIGNRGVSPDRILAVTFTNKAAKEMTERVEEMGAPARGLWISTFHALGVRLLRRHAGELNWPPSFSILDDRASRTVLRRISGALGLPVARKEVREVYRAICRAKNALIGPEEYSRLHADAPNLVKRNAARAYGEYESALRRHRAVDFNDLLVWPVRLFERSQAVLSRYRAQFKHLLVDEYQDTNIAQLKLLTQLGKPRGNVAAVGDDDQCIYTWRGAEPKGILDFEKSFPDARVVTLERNYRSTPEVLEAARSVIRENANRREKKLFAVDRGGRPARESGDPVRLRRAKDEMEEASWIVRKVMGLPKLGEAAVLYRTNAQSRPLEEVLTRRGVAYQLVGGTRFYERREVRRLLAYLRLVVNPDDGEAFDQIANYPARGVGPATRRRLAAFARASGLHLLGAAARAGEAPRIQTRAAEGLERLAAVVRECREMLDTKSASEILDHLAARVGLYDAVAREEGGEERCANLDELAGMAREFDAVEAPELEDEDPELPDLALFLQSVALVADADAHESADDRVSLMTVHSAKGMEFPVVFLTGLEDGLFPLPRDEDEGHDPEEERRLFYVGITRAKERLYLSYARSRLRHGSRRRDGPSTFLYSLPDSVKEQAGAWIGGAGPLPEDGVRLGGEYGPMEDFNQDQPSFAPGERVVHPRFGSGRIVRLSGFGRDLVAQIKFDDGETRKLKARVSKLERDPFH